MKCRFPILVTVKGRQIYVPCGKCAWCVKRLRDEWFLRLKYEGSKAVCRSFVTFTYRDDDLPTVIDYDTGEIIPTVSFRDVQLFHKRLRKNLKFRYMLCSEYGPKTGRPHYHGVYFHDHPYDIAGSWPFGDNNSQYPARDGSYKYILKYILKGSIVPEGAVPNFRSMSRRPGLGYGFSYKGGNYILDSNGVHQVVPRYYTKCYLNSLNDKTRDLIQENKLDYLSELPQHHQFHEEFDSLIDDGSLNPNTSFEDWLSKKYRLDFEKQVKINRK